jgi:anaerobic selenocysteine-containing dehydrogenase
MCFNNCGTKVHIVNGAVVKIEGNPDSPQNWGKLCAKGHAGIMDLYNPNRVKVPLKRANPEKGIGVDPKWIEISWEEAIETVSEKLKKVREDDPRKVGMMSFDLDLVSVSGTVSAFASAFGTPHVWSGGSYLCGAGLHPVVYMMHGTFSFDPDIEHCNYLILFGSQTGFLQDSNAVLRATHMADALARGMKLVVIDPVCSPAAAKANEWVAIRPGTDAAFALAMMNVLLNELKIYDAGFLKKYTNGPYLIGPDGHYIRDKDNNKPLVWDSADEKAKYYDDPDIKDFALEGSYKANGTIGRPAFELLREHVKKYTCEYASEITTVPAETIRRIATEYGEAARIGSTIEIDGKKLPYRPVVAYYRRGLVSHKHSLLNCLSVHLLDVIVGAIDVPGGVLGTSELKLPGGGSEFSWGPTESTDGLLTTGMRFHLSSYPTREVKVPSTIHMLELFPIASYSYPMALETIRDPERFKLNYTLEVLILM